MPTFIRFLCVVSFLFVAYMAALYGLATYVEPHQSVYSEDVSSDLFNVKILTDEVEEK